MEMNKMILVEVAYAKIKEQLVIPVMLDFGSTIAEAISRSGVLTLFPEINLKQQRVGVFSKARELSHVVNHGDRIEIYRPLLRDPKEARRAKAKLSANKARKTR